jgi:hypothetical protein
MLRTEELIRQHEHHFATMNKIAAVLLDMALHATTEYSLSSCHDIKHKLLAKYINVRIYIYCRNKNRDLKQNPGTAMSSKSHCSK